MSRPFIPAPNTASVELIYLEAAEVSENVFHVQKGSPFTLAQLSTLRGVVDSWDNTTAKGGRSGNATLIRIRTKALDAVNSPFEDYYLPTPRVGTLAGTALVLNAAFCVKLATGLAGRSYRGRWYWGHLSTAILADVGHMAPASVTAYVGFLTTLITNLNAAGTPMVITSYRTNNAWRTTAVNTVVTQATAVDTALDSQRRRLPGRGHTV